MTIDRRVVATEKLVGDVLDFFDLGRPVAWVDVGGTWTTNVRADLVQADPVILRAHRRSVPAGRVLAQQAARIVLADAGVPAVRPLANSAGSTVALVEGAAVEAEPAAVWTARMNTAPLLQRGFGVLGRIHDILRSAKLPEAAAEAGWSNWIAADQAAARARVGARRLRDSGDFTLAGLADRADAHLTAVSDLELQFVHAQVLQYVHGDFWDDNVGFIDTRDGPEVAVVLDLGFLGRRPRLDDLALPMWFWLLEPGQATPSVDTAHELNRWLAAYDRNTAQPLSQAERMALPLTIARQPAWVLGGVVATLPEEQARAEARRSVDQLPVAEAVLAQLDQWQQVFGA